MIIKYNVLNSVTESEVNTNNSNMEAAVQSVSEIKPLENHLKVLFIEIYLFT